MTLENTLLNNSELPYILRNVYPRGPPNGTAIDLWHFLKHEIKEGPYAGGDVHSVVLAGRIGPRTTGDLALIKTLSISCNKDSPRVTKLMSDMIPVLRYRDYVDGPMVTDNDSNTFHFWNTIKLNSEKEIQRDLGAYIRSSFTTVGYVTRLIEQF